GRYGLYCFHPARSRDNVRACLCQPMGNRLPNSRRAPNYNCDLAIQLQRFVSHIFSHTNSFSFMESPQGSGQVITVFEVASATLPPLHPPLLPAQPAGGGASLDQLSPDVLPCGAVPASIQHEDYNLTWLKQNLQGSSMWSPNNRLVECPNTRPTEEFDI